MHTAPKIPRCKVCVYVRDTYRYSGRGSSGFSMHYTEQQCSRKAVRDGKCTQHLNDRYTNSHRMLDWHEFWEPKEKR